MPYFRKTGVLNARIIVRLSEETYEAAVSESHMQNTTTSQYLRDLLCKDLVSKKYKIGGY